MAKIVDVSISEVSYLVHKTHKELNAKTQSGGRRERCAEVTPDIVKSLSDIVSTHPQHTLREMHSDLIEKKTQHHQRPVYLHCQEISKLHARDFIENPQ